MQRRRLERDAVERGDRADASSAAPTTAEQILGLQQAAGNQAVGRALARRRKGDRGRGERYSSGPGLGTDDAANAFADYNGMFKQFHSTGLKKEYLQANQLDTPAAWEALAAQAGVAEGPRSVPTGHDRTRVRGLTDEERAAHLLEPRREHKSDGHKDESVFYWAKTGASLETRAMAASFSGELGRAIYVMTEDGKVYTADQSAESSRSDSEEWRFFHSSFLNGQPIAAAGEIIVEKGTLQGISDSSGHYKPTADFTVQMLKNFVADGVDISDVFVEVFDPPSGMEVMYPAPLLIEYQGDSEAMRTDRLDAVATTSAEVIEPDGDGGWRWRANGRALDRRWENTLISGLLTGMTADEVLEDWLLANKRISSAPQASKGYITPPIHPPERTSPGP